MYIQRNIVEAADLANLLRVEISRYGKSAIIKVDLLLLGNSSYERPGLLAISQRGGRSRIYPLESLLDPNIAEFVNQLIE
jgi:hypothetical protein